STWATLLPSLRLLHLAHIPLTDGDFIHWSQKHHEFISLKLKGMYQITDLGLSPFLKAQKNLMILELQDCPEISDEALKGINEGLLRYKNICECPKCLQIYV